MDSPPSSPGPRPGPGAPFDHLAYERASRQGTSGRSQDNPLLMMAVAAFGTFAIAAVFLVVTGNVTLYRAGDGVIAAPTLFEAPVCDGVADGERVILTRSFETMRRTLEGVRLSDQLVAEEICVEVEPIENAGGYVHYERGFFGRSADARLVVARMMLEYGDDDTIASVLVHEATHLDRAINDIDCGRCERLPNGINLDEETAAHAAEAEWWIARYGADGRQSWAPYTWYSIDNLAFAYQRGPDAFREYVRAIREDQDL